jgi:hypothetical protein
LDPAADFCEDNSDFEHACAIAVDLSQNFNFVPPYGEGVDDDFFKIWVKPGLIYGCATSDLSPGVDPNMIVFSGPSFDDAIGGNDDVEPGNFNSAFYYYATYEGWLYLLVGTGDRTPSDIYDSDYTLHCDMAVPATPTSSPTPWSTAEPTRTPPPTATPWPTPEPTPTPPLTATPFLDPTVRLLATPTLAPAVDGQAKVYLPEAFFGGDGSTLIIQLELRNMGTGPFTVELDDISVTSAAGVSELIVVAPRLPWTVQPGQTQVVELQYTRPDASSALFSLLGHSFEISGLQ